jgi:hypothetical protein
VRVVRRVVTIVLGFFIRGSLLVVGADVDALGRAGRVREGLGTVDSIVA